MEDGWPPNTGVSKLCLKEPSSKYFRLAGHVVSVATAQLCLLWPKAAIDTIDMNRCGCVSVKLYLHKQVVDWPAGCG